MKRSFFKIAALLAIGCGAGFLNGLLGAGGGILIVAGLSHLLNAREYDPRAAYATAIAVMLPLSALSALRYASHGHLPADGVGLLALPALLGGALGAWLLRRLSPGVLSRIFAGVVLVSGILLVRR